MGNNSASAKKWRNILVYGGFSGLGRRTSPTKFYPKLILVAMAKLNVDKMGYNSAFLKDISQIFSCSCSGSNTVVAVVVVLAFSLLGVYMRLITI